MIRLNVLLLRPFSESDELIPPFSLGYLATAIRDKHDVVILDDLKEKLTVAKLEQFLERGQYDVVGLQVFTFQVLTAKKYIKIIKRILPRARILLGGPHPSCSPNNIFSFFSEADWAFKGEAEIGFAGLLNLLVDNKITPEHLKDIPGLIWRNGSQVVVNRQVYFDNLDALGIPSWDLIKPNTYPLAPHGGFYKNYPIAPIIISRGCPFSCTYCAGPVISGKKIRYRSADKVIEEIKMLYRQYGIKEIHIEDDNFTFNHDLVKDLCRKLKENNIKITWTCPNGVRLDTLTEELLLIMKEAGLYFISVGIESGSDKILRDMKKNLTTAKIKEKIGLIKKCGLEVSGFFIIGYPTETKKDIMDTINFAVSLDLKRALFSLFKPFPGVEITNELIKKGEWKNAPDEEWAKFVLADAIYAPPGFTLKEMKKLRLRALLRFYFRPKIIIAFLKDLKGPSHWLVVLKRIYSWLFRAK